MSMWSVLTNVLERTILPATVVGSLLLLHSTVVVDKDESAVVLGVGVALGTLVAGAEVAFGVINWQKSL